MSDALSLRQIQKAAQELTRQNRQLDPSQSQPETPSQDNLSQSTTHPEAPSAAHPRAPAVDLSQPDLQSSAPLASGSAVSDANDAVFSTASENPTDEPPNIQEDIIMDDDWEDRDEDMPESATPPPVAGRNPPFADAPQPQPGSSGPTLVPPFAAWVPWSKVQENTPDPFLSHKTTAPTELPPKPSDVHPQKGIYLSYMLVAWLHLQYHLPFRACAVLMQLILLIVRAFGVEIQNPAPLVTLPSIFARLDVNPTFDELPVCPACREVYPAGPDTPFLCPACNVPMFTSPSTSKRAPLLKSPYMSLQKQLTDILSIPGVEAMLDAWRLKPRTSHRYTDIFDGAVAKELKAHDGSPFFQNGGEDGPQGELRIGLTLGLDWLVTYISPCLALADIPLGSRTSGAR